MGGAALAGEMRHRVPHPPPLLEGLLLWAAQGSTAKKTRGPLVGRAGITWGREKPSENPTPLPPLADAHVSGMENGSLPCVRPPGARSRLQYAPLNPQLSL